ncbi:MAG: pseudouridine synthase [Gammaproteobacteria bacterium]|nr:pseudouridine synthase [Gammaproteobacteria bacterium]NIY07940.1 pseudouridine synthase [Gemmatimonadota bacterium]
MLHKPPGVVCTRNDRHGRRTVYDLLPARHGGLFHVGRLDLDSEGLLLLTNEGGVANTLLHPSYEADREYELEVKGRVEDAALRRLLDGVGLEDGPARAHAAELLDAGETSRLRLTLREGRKREVRRMLDAVGHPVLRLVRLRFGPVALGDLAAGAWRRLDTDEVRALRRHASS